MLSLNTNHAAGFQRLSAPTFNRAWGLATQWQQAPAQPNNLAHLSAWRNAQQQMAAGWQSFGDGQVRVAVIDDFVAESNGFNHGQNINQIVSSGGAVVAGQQNQANPSIQTVTFEIDNGGNRNQNIASALNQIAFRASRGEQFDAVNLSQQDFATNGDTRAVNAAIQNLQNNFGIPVVVAAGNNGSENRNSLAHGAAFVVENSTLGSEQRADTSGIGTIRAEGEFTSQATANVSARVAQLREQGFTFQQIQDALLAEARAEGGSLDRPDLNQPQTTPNNAAQPQTTPNNPTQPQTPAPANNGQQWVEHTIQSGDNIWELVVKQGGSTLAEFQKMNPDVNLDLYHPGTVIKIPPRRPSTASAPATRPVASNPAPAPAPAPAETAPTRRGGGGGMLVM